jgi:hypothetical protein
VEGGLTSRIQRIDVNAQVNRLLQPYPLPNLLNNTIRTNLVNLPRLHNLEATVAVVLVVRGAGQGGADAGVDVGVVCEQAFLGRVEEVGAVIDASLFAGCAAKDFRTPSVAEQRVSKAW